MFTPCASKYTYKQRRNLHREYTQCRAFTDDDEFTDDDDFSIDRESDYLTKMIKFENLSNWNIYWKQIGIDAQIYAFMLWS